MIFQFIISILFRKDVEQMAIVYATLIIKGKKTFADVPDKIKDKVKEVLIDLDCPELAKSIQTLSNKVDETNKTLDTMQLRSKRNYATTCRYRIIRFNDELLQKGEHEILHTKEHFDQILEDIDEYEDYCNLDRDYKNSKAAMAIEHIRQVYQKCADEGTFL